MFFKLFEFWGPLTFWWKYSPEKCINIWILLVESGNLTLLPSLAPPHWGLWTPDEECLFKICFTQRKDKSKLNKMAMSWDTLCFHIKKEFLHWSLRMNHEEPEKHLKYYGAFLCVYMRIFLGKICKAFINYQSGMWPQMVRNPKNPREPCAAEPLWWESMLFCAFRELQRRSHPLDPSDLSCVLTLTLSPTVGSGHRSSRASLSFQIVFSVRPMPISRQTGTSLSFPSQNSESLGFPGVSPETPLHSLR